MANTLNKNTTRQKGNRNGDDESLQGTDKVIWDFYGTKIISLRKGNMQNYLIFNLNFNI